MTSSVVPQEHRLLIELCFRHLVHFFWQGPGLLLISRKGLLQVLRDLEAGGAFILGLEGFEVDGVGVHPRLDLVFDSGRVPGFPTPQEVIETWPDDVWVDVTVRVAT
jgi:hypothetical protein